VLASGSVPHLLAPIQLLAKEEDGPGFTARHRVAAARAGYRI
jgi:hypothetical protein